MWFLVGSFPRQQEFLNVHIILHFHREIHMFLCWKWQYLRFSTSGLFLIYSSPLIPNLKAFRIRLWICHNIKLLMSFQTMGHSAEFAFAPDLLKCSMVHSAGSGPVLRAMARSKLWITYIFYSMCSCGNVSIVSSCVSTCRWPSIHVILYPCACDSGYTSQNLFMNNVPQCRT